MTDTLSTDFTAQLNSFIPQGRSGLLPALLAAQRAFGYIPESVAEQIGGLLHVPLSQVYGVIDFYSLLSIHPHGPRTLQVCTGPVCAAAGDRLLDELQRQSGEQSASDLPASPRATVECAPCLGLCNHAPALLAGDTALRQVTPDQISAIFDSADQGAGPLSDHVGGTLSLLTANLRKSEPTHLKDYLAAGGYSGFQSALAMPPADVVAAVKASGLVGRGGAAFPAGIKWEAVAGAAGARKFVVCNADESEPGTFKDRILMERDPHLVLEGMLIAAYATGAQEGVIYIRGEYPWAFQVLQRAVAEAQQAGFLGENIRSSGMNFAIELRQGAGAYICGEETALFESIEGKRGLPRIKPPFPTTHGLFGLPTLINNVETLCNVPLIVKNGAAAYREIGTAQSPGPKLFCLSGDVARPGLYEVPFGTSLRALVYDLAGGIPGGKRLAAVLLGGAAGTFVTEKELDVKLSFEDLRTAGLALGSGAVMVFDDTRDLRDILRRVAAFFAEESCGKCYPCQIGTQRQLEVLNHSAGEPLQPEDIHRLEDVGWTMTDASLCGLGQTAATAVLSALQRWPGLVFDDHQAG